MSGEESHVDNYTGEEEGGGGTRFLVRLWNEGIATSGEV